MSDESPQANETIRRPNGFWLIAIGIGALTIAFFAFMLSLLASSGRDAAALKAMTVAWAALGIGMPLLLAGIIVRAIWFLPGDDSRPRPF